MRYYSEQSNEKRQKVEWWSQFQLCKMKRVLEICCVTVYVTILYTYEWLRW